MVIASASFALQNLIVRMSGQTLPLFVQLLSRNFFLIVLTYIWLKRKGVTIIPKKTSLKDLCLRSLFGFLGTVCVFYANRHLLLADAQILQKLSPFFVALFAWVLTSERPEKRTLLGMVFAFTGALFVIGPAGNFGSIAAIVGLASAVFSALAYTYIHKLTGREDPLRIIFFFSASTFLATLPLAAPDLRVPTMQEVGMLLLIGVFASAGQYFVTSAYQKAPAALISIFDYTGVLLAPLLGIAFLYETPGWPTIAGAVFILLGAWVSLGRNRKHPLTEIKE